MPQSVIPLRKASRSRWNIRCVRRVSKVKGMRHLVLPGGRVRRITPLEWFGGACVVHTCALGGVWWHISGALISSGAPGSRLVAIGRLAGLLVGSAVLVQLALVSRLPWIEPSLGCDRLYRLHRCLGFVVAPLFLG